MDLILLLIIILTILLIFYCNVGNGSNKSKSLIIALPLLGVMQYMNTKEQTYYLNEYKYLQKSVTYLKNTLLLGKIHSFLIFLSFLNKRLQKKKKKRLRLTHHFHHTYFTLLENPHHEEN